MVSSWILLLVSLLSLALALPPDTKTGTTGDKVPASSALTSNEVGSVGLLSLPTHDGNNSISDLSSAHCDVCVNGAQYCDPTWLPEPNLNRALLGVDIAKKHPMPLKPEGDPSYRGIIFNSVFRNTEQGNREHGTWRVSCQ